MSSLQPPFPAYRGLSGFAFVSYAHDDAALVYPILSLLHAERYRIWYDEGIEPGADWADSRGARIEDCELFVLFASSISIKRLGVINEVEFAHKAGKSFCVVTLDDGLELPRAIRVLTGNRQEVDGVGRTRCEIVADLRTAFDLSEVLVGDTDATSGDAGGNGDTAEGYGDDADDYCDEPPLPPVEALPISVSVAFADRVPESVAVQRSVARQRARITHTEPIVPEVFPNVLAFHGGSGMGKTGLSERLQKWVTHKLDGSVEWGRWPHSSVVAVRWDFHESDGAVDVVNLIAEMRTALTALDHQWLAFDVALARYLEATRTTDSPNIPLSGAAQDAVLRSLIVVAHEIGSSSPTALTPATARRIANDVLETPVDRRGRLARLGMLDTVLTSIISIPQGTQGVDAAAQLLYLLTVEISRIRRDARPVIVVFIDAFEKVQRSRARTSEAVIAKFITCLQYVLFVITGRDKLDWADPARTDLVRSGPAAWPGLVPGAEEDPRQHLLRRLSDSDTEGLYRAKRDAAGWAMSDELIAELVRRSAGLPLHIDVVFKLAGRLVEAEPGRELTAEDLNGELPEVVTRLIDRLSDEEADAFRAACVLSSFDIPLVMAVAGVSQGAVERMIRYALVDEVTSSIYPYRVHDEIRKLVCLDRVSHRYWGDADWDVAARRGMREALGRVSSGKDSASDEAQIHGIALAIRLGYEWDIYLEGTVKLVTDGPTIVGLAPHIPVVAETDPRSDMGDLIRFVHALALPYPDAGDALLSIGSPNPEIDRFIRRWAGYRLRSVARFDEALEQFREVTRYPDNSAIPRNQIGLTLRTARRFRDAIEYAREHSPGSLDRLTRGVNRLQGIEDLDLEGFAQRITTATSRRFRNELEANVMLLRARFIGGVTPGEAQQLLQRSFELGLHSDHRVCLVVKGYQSVVDDDDFGAVITELDELLVSYRSTSASALHLRTLRALHTGRPDDARPAYDALLARTGDRGTAWIPIEVWLEELGYDVPEYPGTQWTIPYEQVRQNWLTVARGIIDRSAARYGHVIPPATS